MKTCKIPPLYAFLLLLLTSCTGSKIPQTKTPELITWKLDFISGINLSIDALYPNVKPVIIFNNSSMIVHGHNGCNDFSTPFTSQGGSLKISGPGKQTMKACPGPGEIHFMHQLKAIDSFGVSANRLVLYGKKIPLMRFTSTK